MKNEPTVIVFGFKCQSMWIITVHHKIVDRPREFAALK